MSVLIYLLFFFFFKQKTAYEMRISDWSSDVCSSDLEMLDFTQLELGNDFAAQSMAIPALRQSDVIAIGGATWKPDATPANRTYAVIGPGTGLGVGVLVVRDGHYWPLETEGGHVSFPPGTPEEIAIL